MQPWIFHLFLHVNPPPSIKSRNASLGCCRMIVELAWGSLDGNVRNAFSAAVLIFSRTGLGKTRAWSFACAHSPSPLKCSVVILFPMASRALSELCNSSEHSACNDLFHAPSHARYSDGVRRHENKSWRSYGTERLEERVAFKRPLKYLLPFPNSFWALQSSLLF